ncbi:zonular occludens toxin domain-containing protein [Acinetobacter indicus]|uniref:zonular occludens toxin domain-containing protein n=1 Tax=Acinetobacter indicus TaxID=756892 RepID=UPI003214326F
MSELLLITGKKGHGKSLWAVDEAFKAYDQGKFDHYFSDIDEFRHKGYKPVDDWRDCPNNSLIILDEVQFKKCFSRLGQKFDMQVAELTTMRKRGITIWLITQRARLLNPDVLALVDRHIHIERNGQKSSRVYEFSDAETNITKTKKLFAQDKYVYTHNDELYAFYKSIQPDAKHFKKSWINKNAVSTIITMVLVGCFGIFFLYKFFAGGINITGGNEQVVKQNDKSTPKSTNTSNIQSTNPQVSQVSTPVVQPLSETDLKYCMTSFNWSAVECNKYYRPMKNDYRTENIDEFNNVTPNVSYNPSDPYGFESVNYSTPSTYPKFSGCAKFDGQYYAYTQQGTLLNVKESDCRRLLNKAGDRPFDYFAADAPGAGQLSNTDFLVSDLPIENNIIQ